MSLSNPNDQRLEKLGCFHLWLNKWQTAAESSHFLLAKLWFDLQSMFQGVSFLVTIKLSEFPDSVIRLWIINQDLVENHFCQIRACNGQNNNPSYRLQESTQNSIRYGQTTVSHKCNAGKAMYNHSSSCSLAFGDKV